MIRAVLFDVGGTLWPDRPGAPRLPGVGTPGPGGDPLVAAAAARISVLLGLGAAEALVLAARLADDRGADRGDAQHTAGHVARTVRAVGLDGRGLDPGALQRAMCLPAAQVVQPFTGARDVLRTARELGLAVAVVSNARWRDGEAYQRDFADLGLATYVDAYVSSVDVGFRKPHPSMFRTALDALDAAPAVAAMVGNSVANDITPARDLGMRTVLVAIEEAAPVRSAADAVCTSLAEVGNWLRGAAGPSTGR